MPKLFGRIIIPDAVFDELVCARTPMVIKRQVVSRPEWLVIEQAPLDPTLLDLDKGEREAIAIAVKMRANYLIIDDNEGRMEATRRHLTIIGTAGVLTTAAENNLLRLDEAVAKLIRTNFRIKPSILSSLVDRDLKRRRAKSGDNE